LSPENTIFQPGYHQKTQHFSQVVTRKHNISARLSPENTTFQPGYRQKTQHFNQVITRKQHFSQVITRNHNISGRLSPEKTAKAAAVVPLLRTQFCPPVRSLFQIRDFLFHKKLKSCTTRKIYTCLKKTNSDPHLTRNY
jgi:hypothetical protein